MNTESKLTQEMADQLIESCKVISNARSAEEIGISERSLYRWRNTGKDALEKAPSRRNKHEKLCAHLFLGMNRANVRAEKDASRRVSLAADDDWRAAAWVLERRWGERWGRQRIELTGKDGGPLQVEQIAQAIAEDGEHADTVADADGGGTLDS